LGNYPTVPRCFRKPHRVQKEMALKKYLIGAPELIAEVAATSASLDHGD
jgi:hypothetical protein